jgi:lipoprotein-releasing system ATP-binding protein
MSLLAFCGVSKRVKDGMREVCVLDGVSFELYEGETVGVRASRGAGKTTLLRVAAGLEMPDEGEVRWRGRDLVGLGADERARVRRRGGIALASGDWRPSVSLRVIEHVARPLYSEGLRMTSAERCARDALACVGAPELGHVLTGRLSVVERLRVELARAIARRPALLLFDEPAVLAQPKDAQAFCALLHSLPRSLGMALLIASEDVSALRGAGRVMNLDGGRMYATESRRNVVSFPERRGRRVSAEVR